MLTKFLKNHQTEILALAEEKTLQFAEPLPSSIELRKGLPKFYNLLMAFLDASSTKTSEKSMKLAASLHGQEMLRLNYSLSHVVHAYGAMCQAITELAHRRKAEISAENFNDLNHCLDVAIASAVSEYQFHSVHKREEDELLRIGFLAHELRNALSSATVASDMIRKGLVGTGGSTAKVLEENLIRMRILIDRSLSEVRMKSAPEIIIERFYLDELVDQILLTAQIESGEKKQILENTLNEKFELVTDRQLLLSVIANLIQNAIKYSKAGGIITVRAKPSDENIVIEIQDECGGLEPDWIKNMFEPFISGSDRSGLGLGLTICKRAVSLLQGKINVYNNSGLGCSFFIEIPKILKSKEVYKKTINGKDSAQPIRKKKKKS